MSTLPPIVWTIAGSDSSGGAGLQADLLTMQAFGVHACSVVTAVTAQSMRAVTRIDALPPDAVAAQIDALHADLPPAAIKIGMLASGEIGAVVADRLRPLDAPVVYDPVLRASDGASLLEDGGLERIRGELFPQVTLLTPNLPEAETLVGQPLTTDADIEQAASALCEQGPGAVLIKGGHRGGAWAQDYYTDGKDGWWITTPRLNPAGSHGGGCTYASAITASLAQSDDLRDAIAWGKAFIHQALRRSIALPAATPGPLFRGELPHHSDDLPWITPTAEPGRAPREFPSLPRAPIGLYPIVDTLEEVKRLLPHHPRWLQLRIKGAWSPEIDAHIAEAIRLADGSQTTLVINDHWESALRHGAKAVHLGQDDLDTRALDALAENQIALGLSTHSLFEIARAWGERPSYLAIGTLFRTTSKVMDYQPLGLPAFTALRALIPIPVVAIGGIHLDRAAEVYAAGADGIAVISEMRDSPDPAATLAAWDAILPGSQ